MWHGDAQLHGFHVGTRSLRRQRNSRACALAAAVVTLLGQPTRSPPLPARPRECRPAAPLYCIKVSENSITVYIVYALRGPVITMQQGARCLPS